MRKYTNFIARKNTPTISYNGIPFCILLTSNLCNLNLQGTQEDQDEKQQLVVYIIAKIGFSKFEFAETNPKVMFSQKRPKLES